MFQFHGTDRGRYKPHMKFIRRLFLSLPLMAVAGFCIFGFVATFEPLPRIEQWTWRTVYLAVGGGSVLAICWMWLRPKEMPVHQRSRES